MVNTFLFSTLFRYQFIIAIDASHPAMDCVSHAQQVDAFLYDIILFVAGTKVLFADLGRSLYARNVSQGDNRKHPGIR